MTCAPASQSKSISLRVNTLLADVLDVLDVGRLSVGELVCGAASGTLDLLVEEVDILKCTWAPTSRLVFLGLGERKMVKDKSLVCELLEGF